MTDTPLRHPFLDLAKEDLPYRQAMVDAARRVIESGRYIGGPEVDRLEKSLAKMFGAPHAIGVANGLDALRLSLRACIIEGLLRPADEVIVPANTFIASVLAITDAGLTPVLVDPDPVSMCLNGDIIARHITPRTRAIMPVHLYGRIAWDQTMRHLALTHHLLVIEDAAQAIGARAYTPGMFDSDHAGAIGHIGAFSFYPTKNIGAVGDAGAVLTHLPGIAETVRALANYGSIERYRNIYQGFNSRLDPIQAAMIAVKLADIHTINSRRRDIAQTYHTHITNPHITKPTPTDAERPLQCVWHQYVVATPHRHQLRQYLAAHGIGTDIHYPTPPHLQPCYATPATAYNLPVAEMLAQQVLSLPIGPGTTSVADAIEISNIINQFSPTR